MFSLCEERYPNFIVIEAGRTAAGGGGDLPGDGIARTFTIRIANDCVVYGLSWEARSAGAGFPLSLNAGIRIKDSRDQQWWFRTRPLDGALVPVALVCGSMGEPYIWPEPRILRRGAELTVEIATDDQDDLAHVRLAFVGARIKIDGQGELCDELAEYDARDRGYSACIVWSDQLPTPTAPMVPSPAFNMGFTMGSMPYDQVFTDAALIVLDNRQPPTASNFNPVVGYDGELNIRDTSAEHDLMLRRLWLPWSYFGGQTQQAAQPTLLRPVATALGSAWRVKQDSAFEINYRVLLAETVCRVVMAFHGRRDTCLGRVATVRELQDPNCVVGQSYRQGPLEPPVPLQLRGRR